LNNREAKHELQIQFRGQVVVYNRSAKYQGGILDRNITFKENLTDLAAKIYTRYNIISWPSGSSWGTYIAYD